MGDYGFAGAGEFGGDDFAQMIPTVTKVMSNEGSDLDPEDGFIVWGCIFAAQVDDKGHPVGVLVDANIEPEVFTKEEMLKALMFTVDDLKKTLEGWEKRSC